LLFLQYKCYFFWCAEQKKIEQAVQTFAALWHEFCRSENFCRLMARVLPPYGPVLINRAQYNKIQKMPKLVPCSVVYSRLRQCERNLFLNFCVSRKTKQINFLIRIWTENKSALLYSRNLQKFCETVTKKITKQKYG